MSLSLLAPPPADCVGYGDAYRQADDLLSALTDPISLEWQGAATSVLALFLHAAALAYRPMSEVAAWVACTDPRQLADRLAPVLPDIPDLERPFVARWFLALGHIQPRMWLGASLVLEQALTQIDASGE